VYLLRSVELTLIAETEKRPGVETGGVLVGFVDARLIAVVVTAASGPGPRATHGRYHFNRDARFCQRFLDESASATRGVVDFVGEWHKHPEPDPHPSSQDRATYVALAGRGASDTPRPLVLIVGTWPTPRGHVYVGTNAFVFSADGFEQRKVEWRADDAYADLRD